MRPTRDHAFRKMLAAPRTAAEDVTAASASVYDNKELPTKEHGCFEAK